MSTERIDYAEQDIYDYFGADQNIWKADRLELIGIIGGMSGILELIWHDQVSAERSFKDFKDWLKETQALSQIQVEVEDDARKKG